MPFKLEVDDDAKASTLPKFCYVNPRRGAVHWRHGLGASAKPKQSKCGGGGENGRLRWWRRRCLRWRCARAASAALLAAWIAVMLVFDPLSTNNLASSAREGASQTNSLALLQGAVPIQFGPPGICARIAGVAGPPPPKLTRTPASAWFLTPGRAASFQQQQHQEQHQPQHHQTCLRAGSGAQRSDLLVVVLVDADTAATCAKATVAAQTLKRRQTLGCFDVAMLVLKQDPDDRVVGARAEHLSGCPKVRALEATHVLSRDFVVFVDNDEVDRLLPAALEKLVLVAHGEDADVISIAPDAQQALSTVCIRNRLPEDEDAEEGNRRPRRHPSITCRGAGAPVILRVPQWLPDAQLKVWTAAVADAIRMPLPSSRSSKPSSPTKLQRVDDGLAALFCVGQANGMSAHALREAQSLHVSHGYSAEGRGAAMVGSTDGEPSGSGRKRRLCRAIDKQQKAATTATDERRDLSAIREQRWTVIADAYITRAYNSKDAPNDASAATVPEDGRHRITRSLRHVGGASSRVRSTDAAVAVAAPAAAAAAAPASSTMTAAPGFLLVVPWLEHGGADQFNVNLARELTRLGVRVVVVTTLSSANPTAPDFYDITPDIFHLPHLVMSPRDTARVLDVLAYLVASRGVEVVMISHSALGYELLPSFRAAVVEGGEDRVVRFVDYVHLEEVEWGGGGYAAMSVAHAQHLDHTFAASQHVAAWMRSRAGVGVGGLSSAHPPPDSPSRISVAYIGVDTQLLRPMSPRARLVVRHELFKGHAIAPDVPVVAYLARMVDQKLPELYFEIIRQLREERRAVFASVAIGGGPRLDELRANLSRLRSDLDRPYGPGRRQRPSTPHLALGMLDHGAAVRVLAASDILLLPSRNEGIALATYEAMSLGVTPVVSAVGGQCELVSPGAGACVSVDPGAVRSDRDGVLSPDGLADAATAFVDELERLITSRELLKKRRSEAHRAVEEKFNMQHTVRALGRGLQCSGV